MSVGDVKTNTNVNEFWQDFKTKCKLNGREISALLLLNNYINGTP